MARPNSTRKIQRYSAEFKLMTTAPWSFSNRVGGMSLVETHRKRGDWLDVSGNQIFVFEEGEGPVVLALHGFPSSSLDYAELPEGIEARFVAPDFLGYGLSDKPFDASYSLFDQADLVEEVAKAKSIERCVLLTHDMGDSVGAELIARQLEGKLSFEIRSVLLTNGSIFIEMSQLSPGQLLLLEMGPDPLPEPLPLEGFRPALEATFPEDEAPPEVIDAMLELTRLNGGDRLLPKLIQYIEERRQKEQRWIDALVNYEGPLTVAWGELDPIAVVAMAHRLQETRPATRLVTWSDIAHWPSIEAPGRLRTLLTESLAEVKG